MSLGTLVARWGGPWRRTDDCEKSQHFIHKPTGTSVSSGSDQSAIQLGVTSQTPPFVATELMSRSPYPRTVRIGLTANKLTRHTRIATVRFDLKSQVLYKQQEEQISIKNSAEVCCGRKHKYKKVEADPQPMRSQMP